MVACIFSMNRDASNETSMQKTNIGGKRRWSKSSKGASWENGELKRKEKRSAKRDARDKQKEDARRKRSGSAAIESASVVFRCVVFLERL
jgi:hypothetical protein